MAAPVIMPRQGQSVESCIIAKWYKNKGDTVKAGDLLFSYETDKASFEEEAKVDGTLLEIFFGEGDDVPVLTNVCVIGNPGESTGEFHPDSGGASVEEPGSAVQQAKEDKPVAAALESKPVQAIAQDSQIKISPRARNLAEKTGVDYRYANPSGPRGRIIEQDVALLKEQGYVVTASARDEYMKAGTVQTIEGTGIGRRITTGDLAVKPALEPIQKSVDTSTPYEEVKLTNIRKVIAKAMHHSLSSTAQLTCHSSFDATEILECRKKLKEGKDRLGLNNITINDMILYAVSRTILCHKDLNAHFLDEKMLLFKNVNLGIAVDTDRGLMVPTLFNANLKTLNEISCEAKALIKDCQSGTINPDLLKGGSFTITNLGTLDIELFTPVLNPPQTGILGVNTIVQRAREVDGEYVYYPAMGLSLTFDHRAVDGAPAAKFLQDLKKNLENFRALMAK